MLLLWLLNYIMHLLLLLLLLLQLLLLLLLLYLLLLMLVQQVFHLPFLQLDLLSVALIPLERGFAMTWGS